MSSQFNNYNGGPVLPGNTVTADALKSLKLRHTKPGANTPSVEEYHPLTEKTVDFQNIVFTKGGTSLGTYDPLNSGGLTVEIPEDVNIVPFDSSSPSVSKATYDAIKASLDANRAIFLASSSGSAAVYWMPCAGTATGYQFYHYSDGINSLRLATIAHTEGSGGSHALTVTDIRLKEIVYCQMSISQSDAMAIINSGGLPIMQEVGGQGNRYYYPQWGGSGLYWVNVDDYSLRQYKWNGGGWTLSEIVWGDQDSYIKTASCTESGWLSNWASANGGGSFGDILGVVCASGNNKAYTGSCSVTADDCGCVPCGFIIFLDESADENKRKDDEARNYSVDVTVSISTNSGYGSEADAKSHLPEALWLRVFGITQYSGGKQHGNVPCSRVYDNGVFVDLDTVHLKVEATYNDDNSQWFGHATAHFQVCVVNRQWTFALQGIG